MAAPSGGGGGGGPVGFTNSFTGPSQQLELIGITAQGQHSWGGWSGKVLINADTGLGTVTAFDFLSPNYGCIMRINFGYNAAGGGLGNDSLGYFLYFNDTQVMSVIPRNTAGQNNPDFHVTVIPIPAFTQVKLQHYTTETGNVNTFSILSVVEV